MRSSGLPPAIGWPLVASMRSHERAVTGGGRGASASAAHDNGTARQAARIRDMAVQGFGAIAGGWGHPGAPPPATSSRGDPGSPAAEVFPGRFASPQTLGLPAWVYP